MNRRCGLRKRCSHNRCVLLQQTPFPAKHRATDACCCNRHRFLRSTGQQRRAVATDTVSCQAPGNRGVLLQQTQFPAKHLATEACCCNRHSLMPSTGQQRCAVATDTVPCQAPGNRSVLLQQTQFPTKHRESEACCCNRHSSLPSTGQQIKISVGILVTWSTIASQILREIYSTGSFP